MKMRKSRFREVILLKSLANLLGLDLSKWKASAHSIFRVQNSKIMEIQLANDGKRLNKCNKEFMFEIYKDVQKCLS